MRKFQFGFAEARPSFFWRAACISIVCALSFSACAQKSSSKIDAGHLPPQTDWEHFGFQKQVKQAATVYYKSDEKGYEPSMLEVYSFNDSGQLMQEYIRIFGKYGSETAYNHTYKQGQLDSINSFATAANFNSQQVCSYDRLGRLSQIESTGKYSAFTDTYNYDKEGLLRSILRKHKSGIEVESFFDHERELLRKEERTAAGKTKTSYSLYDGKELFASFDTEEDSIIELHSSKYRLVLRAQIAETPLDYALALRELKQSDEQAFEKKFGSLQGQASTKIIKNIPAEASNEQGDWTKRLQIDGRFVQPQRSMVFRKLIYSDGTESGSTDYDMIFEKKVSRFK